MTGKVFDLSDYYGGPHAHCFSCHSFKLCSRVAGAGEGAPAAAKAADDYCDFVTCPKCGWVYHGCKGEEHELLCQRETVDCINVELGCPVRVSHVV